MRLAVVGLFRNSHGAWWNCPACNLVKWESHRPVEVGDAWTEHNSCAWSVPQKWFHRWGNSLQQIDRPPPLKNFFFFYPARFLLFHPACSHLFCFPASVCGLQGMLVSCFNGLLPLPFFCIKFISHLRSCHDSPVDSVRGGIHYPFCCGPKAKFGGEALQIQMWEFQRQPPFLRSAKFIGPQLLPKSWG